MGAIRDIIIHVDVEVAARRRTCHHNRQDHCIVLGQKCLVVRDSDGGRKNYCPLCAMEILRKAERKLAALQLQFGADPPPAIP